VGAVRSVWRVAHIQPAVALRPAPPAGARIVHRGLLGTVWDRLPVVWRITLRNSLRARSRTFFSTVGVAFAMMMLVVSTSMDDLFDFIIDWEFNRSDRSDVQVDFFAERPESAVLEVGSVRGVRRAEGLFQFGAELRNGWHVKDAFIVGLPRGGSLRRVCGTDGTRITMPRDGLVLPRRLARQLDLGPGSTVRLDPYLRGKDAGRAHVRMVVDQYVGLVVYADRDYLCRAIGEGPLVNSVLASAGGGVLEGVVSRLNDLPGVAAVSTPRAKMEGFRESVADMMRMASLVQTVIAGILAFAVIYNTSSVNIAEQERDLACLSSLGYGRSEVAAIGTDDIMPLTLVGLAAGVPLGVLSCVGISRAYETDIYRLPVVIAPEMLVRCGILVLVFSLIARWACRRRVYRIDIVRRLKTME
jgi:putative ABC transport system permease protein